MASVWVVEYGEYSGRSVSGVYSSEESARLAAGSEGDVTEFELDAGMQEYRSGLRCFSVEMDKDGNTRKVETCGFLTGGSSFGMRLASLPPIGQPYIYDHVSALVWAKDEQHAVKITNEQRAQIIASGEWDKRQSDINRNRQIA